MAYEDFQNNYTEEDTAGRIALSTSTLTFTQQEREEDSRVAKNFGASYFPTGDDFTHKFMFKLTGEFSPDGLSIPWQLANQFDSWDDIRGESDDDLNISIYQEIVRLGCNDGGSYSHSDTTSTLAVDGTQYYFTIDRTSGTMTMRIHTVDYYGEPGSNEFETETEVDTTGTDFDYLYGYNCHQVASGHWYSGEVKNMEIVVAAGGLSIPIAFHHLNKNIGR